MEQFTNDGLSFEVTDAGSATDELIVLLHGFPESRAAWDHVTPHLVTAGYRVLAPNQRGYSRGARPKGRRSYTLDKLGRDVIAMVDEAGVDRFHVVGHDWGGMVAWELAANHPERIKTMTSLATPHPRALIKAGMRSTQLLKSYYVFLFQLPLVPERSLSGPLGGRTWAQLEKSGLPAEYTAAYRQLFDEPGTAQAALNWYRAVPFGSLNRVGSVHIPAMYVYATKDMALGRKAADLTGDYVSGPYRYEILDGVSHWIPEEVPDATADLVVDFVRSVTP